MVYARGSDRARSWRSGEATGSGKSTLVSLLARLLDPVEGSVRVGSDEHGFNDVRRLDLRAHGATSTSRARTASCSRTPSSRTCGLARPHASLADVKNALELSAASDDARQLARGPRDPHRRSRYHPIGRSTPAARPWRGALPRAASILVLDDSTSALDAVTEQTILSTSASSDGERGPSHHPLHRRERAIDGALRR